MKALLLIIALLFAGNAVVQSQEPPPAPSKASEKPQANPKQHKQYAAEDQRGTESSPVFIKVIPPRAVEPQPTKEAEKHDDYTSSEWWLVYITGALVCFTFGLMIYTARLWGATQTLAKDARITATQQATDMQSSLNIAGDAAKAAQESADAAKAMVSTMDDTAERQLRAYALISRVEIKNNPRPELPGQWVYVSLKNFGQTPATDISYLMDMQIRENPLLSPPLTRDPSTKREMVGILAPGDTLMTRFRIPLLNGTGDGYDIEQGTHAFYVFGIIRYKDAFGRERITPFRYMRSGKHWLSDCELDVCEEGNDAT